jgi:von Willebrand factor type A domain-containing protein
VNFDMSPKLLNSDALAFLAIVGLGLVIFYRYVYQQEGRQARRLTGKQTFWLWMLRTVIAALTLLALARPAIEREDVQTRRPAVAFLVDGSSSMSFPAARGNALLVGQLRNKRTRFDVAKIAVQQLQEKLTRTHVARAYTFADTLDLLRELEYRESDSITPTSLTDIFKPTLQAAGDYSNLGDGIGDVRRQMASDLISGIIMVTDGRQTGGTELKKAVAAAAAAKIPINVICTGSEYPLRDLRIDEVKFPAEASLGDVLTFHLDVTNQISSRLDVELNLYESDPQAAEDDRDHVAKKKLTLKRGLNRVSIATIPETEGLREFRIELPKQEDEVNTENNVATVHVKVVRRTLRVVLIAGKPSREYLFMVPALLRDPIIKLSCYLQSGDVDYTHQGNVNIDRLPKDVREWESFDVAILMDIDPNGITAQQIAGLDNMVLRGGGLMVMAGRNNGMAKLVQVHAARVRSMLPVEIDKNLYPNYDKFFTKPVRVKRTKHGKGHPIMFASSDGAENESLWETFPQFYWYHPVVGPQTKAITLLESDGPVGDGGTGNACLMAIQRYGEGSVFFSAVDSLWRWRYPYESFDYDRLWTRIVRYLGETKLMGGQQQVALGTDRRSYSPGERVQIRLQVLDPALMAQLAGQQVFAAVTSSTKAKHMVELRPRSDGMPIYEGNYTARHEGSMVVSVRQIVPDGPSDQKPLFDIKTSFVVKRQSLENKDTSADLKGMADVARATGGKYYDHRTLNAAALNELVKSIPTEQQKLSQTIQFEVWDGLPFLILFLVLISAEWSLRKLWGLL